MIFKPHPLEPFTTRTVIIHKVRYFTVCRSEQLAESEYVRLESLFKWIPETLSFNVVNFDLITKEDGIKSVFWH